MAQSRDFYHTPPAFDGRSSSECRDDVWYEKVGLEWCGYQTDKNNFEATVTRFDRIHEHNGRTDRHADGRTPHYGIGRAHIAVRNNKTGYSILVNTHGVNLTYDVLVIKYKRYSVGAYVIAWAMDVNF